MNFSKIFTSDNISNALIVSGILILFILYMVMNSENFENFKNNLKNLNYIYPEQLKQICGNGTKPGNQRCIPDDDFVAQQLIKQNMIQEIDSEIVFTPRYAYEEPDPEVPKWFFDWVDKGAYSCQTLIEKGVCNINDNNCEAPCRCGDCAGWRGGNMTDCNNKSIGGGRVWCNLEPGEPFTFKGEPDACECAYGHCAINGLCVSPYKMDGTKDNKRCCPTCSFKNPDIRGGCAGSVKCDPSIECEESIVQLPGIQYKPDLSNQFVTLVDTLCPSKDSDDPNCYHPEHPNAMRTQPFIKVSPNESNSFNDLSPIETNTAAGENEYECAIKCGDTQGKFDNDRTVNTQYECSKRCLPKLWRWYPVFEELSEGLKYTGGYYQSDELMRYLPSDAELRVCMDPGCVTDLSIPEFPQFNNCTECENCNYTYSPYKNNNGFQDVKYDCDRCKQCILNQNLENGDKRQVVCKNMVGCNTCQDNTPEFILDATINYKECDTCLGADQTDETAGCKVYTLDPYKKTGNEIKYRTDSKIYNHGGDPYIDYINKSEDGYDPNSRNSGCDFYIFSGAKTCDNQKGLYDGGYFRNYDCRQKCTPIEENAPPQ